MLDEVMEYPGPADGDLPPTDGSELVEGFVGQGRDASPKVGQALSDLGQEFRLRPGGNRPIALGRSGQEVGVIVVFQGISRQAAGGAGDMLESGTDRRHIRGRRPPEGLVGQVLQVSVQPVQDLVKALEEVGLSRGDVRFVGRQPRLHGRKPPSSDGCRI